MMKLRSFVRIATGVAVIGGIAGREILKRRLARAVEVRVKKVVVVRAEPGEVYDRLRDFESYPRFLSHVSRVKSRTDGTAEWEIAEGPVRLRFRTTLIDDVPNKSLVWRSRSGGDLHQEGAVLLMPAPGDAGTEVHFDFSYVVPGGSRGPARDWIERYSVAQLSAELCCTKPWIECGRATQAALQSSAEVMPPSGKKPLAKVRLSIVGRDKAAS
jgi:uncharacterized membrane protein